MSEQVLINRETIHRTRPIAKAVLAVICWGNSLTTTVLSALEVERKITEQTTALGAGIGIALAIALTLGQIFTSDASPRGYWAFLAPDVGSTAVQWFRPLRIMTRAFIPFHLAADFLAGILSLIIGYYSARLPERMIFGPRRKRHGRSDESN